MANIGGTPPASPSTRKPMKSSQEELQPRTPRGQMKSSPRKFAIPQADVRKVQGEIEDALITEKVLRTERAPSAVLVEVEVIEKTEIVSSPRKDVDEKSSAPVSIEEKVVPSVSTKAKREALKKQPREFFERPTPSRPPGEQAAPQAEPEKQTFAEKRAFFEGASSEKTTTSRTTTTTTTSSRPPDRPLPAPPADPEVHSPRRQTRAELPAFEPSQSEKPS
jgi:hypothetical protein